MSIILRPWIFLVLLPATAGCVSTGPQEIDLKPLQQVLQRLNARPEILASLPAAFSDYSGGEDRNCRKDNIATGMTKTYSKYRDDKPLWFIGVTISVHCSEEFAFQYNEATCKIGWSRTSRNTVDIVSGVYGSTCVSSILQQRNQGIIPANAFISYAAAQSGVIVVAFSETYRGSARSAKQVAIDDATERFLKVLNER